MNTQILKEQALAAYDGKVTKLAAALGLTHSAVSQWASGQPIPERHALKLRYVLLPKHKWSKS